MPDVHKIKFMPCSKLHTCHKLPADIVFHLCLSLCRHITRWGSTYCNFAQKVCFGLLLYKIGELLVAYSTQSGTGKVWGRGGGGTPTMPMLL